MHNPGVGSTIGFCSSVGSDMVDVCWPPCGDRTTTWVGDPPESVSAAERAQLVLRREVELRSALTRRPVSVVGVDVSYEKGSERAVAAAVAVDVDTHRVRESALVVGQARFPYVPGLLAFREAPLVLQAVARLTCRPEVLMCDGYGIAHPRRCGLACHVGVVTGVPTFGVAKSVFIATSADPGVDRGEWASLRDGGSVVGRAVRTRAGVKPVFVSVGHRISLEEATSLTVELTGRFRIPEPLRQADMMSRAALRHRFDES